MKVLKNFRTADSEATLYGKEAHKEMEDFLLYGTPINPRFKKFEPFAVKIKALSGDHYVEYPMGIKEDGTACKFDDADVWWHGIPDVLVVNRESGIARVVDWKFGKSSKYADVDQLELLALATFAKHPEVHTVKGALIFLVANDVVKKDFSRDQFGLILSKWIGKIDRIGAAHASDVWNPQKGPLCKFCPVNNKRCEYASS